MGCSDFELFLFRGDFSPQAHFSTEPYTDFNNHLNPGDIVNVSQKILLVNVPF